MGHAERAHARLSASSSARWLRCPPSARAAEAYQDNGTDYAAEGTLAHEVAEGIVRSTLLHELVSGDWDEVDTEMLRCANSYRDYISGLIASDDPAILLEQRVDFSRWVPEGFGTADCVIIQDKVMDVIDYKYGKGVMVSAADNSQESLYGLGAWNEYNFAYDIETVRLHIFQPRMDNISVCEMRVEDLLAWGEYVKPIAKQAAAGKGKYAAGEWCRFCPHAGRCRALNAACTEVVSAHGGGLGMKLPVLAPFEIAEVLRQEPMISLWLRRVKEQALRTLMDGGEIPGYKVVEGREGNRKWTDEAVVLKTLTDAGLTAEEVTETKLLSPAAMDKALGKKRAAELLTDYIDRSPGAPAVVPETDKRPALDRLAEAQNDFN